MRRFQSIADALRALPAKDLILEGEAVVARGIRDFELLQADLVAGRKDRLLYAGKVRGGFTEADARDLRERLDQFIPKDSPLAEPVNKPKATCVEPVLEAEVACSTLTENSLLREAVLAWARIERCRPPRPGGKPLRGEHRLKIRSPPAAAGSRHHPTAHSIQHLRRAAVHLRRAAAGSA